MASLAQSRTQPSTPSAATPQPLPPLPQPGTWIHPSLSEIARRRNASTFTNSNVQKILYNLAALILPPLLQHAFPTVTSPFTKLLSSTDPISYYLTQLLRLVFLYNITTAALPLLRAPDDLVDIPLTPSQRALLGLDPSAAVASTSAPTGTTPQTYATPPRYPRSATPRTGSAAGSPSSGSPFSDSPLLYKTVPGSSMQAPARSASPFSPGVSAMSPVLQRALTQRRESYGGGAGGGGGGILADTTRRRESSVGAYQSPLARSITAPSLTEADFGISVHEPATPSPIGVRRAAGGVKGSGVGGGISGRWLFERGRGSPGSVSSVG